ncbi:hypothetical protein ACSSS7_005345 [Eimeria intestinalis]
MEEQGDEAPLGVWEPPDSDDEGNSWGFEGVETLLGALLVGLLLFFLYKAVESWAQNREAEAEEARRRQLREARARHAAALEAEMEAFKATPAYAELERASAAATGGVRPEHRGQISRHGVRTPGTAPKPWRPNPAERYGRTRRGGGGG